MSPDEQVYARRWWTLGVLCVSLLVVGLDNTILNVAIPTLQTSLKATQGQIEWIIDSYVLVFAGLLLTMGALGDKFGRRRALTYGLVIFGIGSVLSAFSGSANVLIATRALMGVGGALIMPSTLSILTNVFPPAERGRAIAIWAGVSGLGIGVGPIAGGLLLEHFWWGSIFLVNVPVVIAAIVAGRFLVPESRDERAPRLDPAGAGLSIVGLSALVYAIIEAPTKGWLHPEIIGMGLAGVAIIALFVFNESRSDHPMLPVEFFKNPRFSAGSGAVTLAFFALFGTTLLLVQYQQLVRGYDALGSGIRVVPVAVALVLFAPRSAGLAAKFGTKRVVATGLTLLSITLASLRFFEVGTPYWKLGIVYFFMGAAMAHVVAPATEAIMGSLPRNRAGVGSAVNDTTRQVGGALGVAILGSLLSSAYAAHVRPVLETLPPSARAEARDSLVKTMAVAAHTFGEKSPQTAQIVHGAQVAFTDAMGTVALVAAAFALLGALAVVLFLPAQGREEEAELASLGLPEDEVAPEEAAAR
ncbi:MAG TPA: MFS transporter [Mycobacteriales bacterium]|jgi:EmrB/QacA subfamily drug resistance transporter|nr:MFS transporter [Mycobacteriales bacterium]